MLLEYISLVDNRELALSASLNPTHEDPMSNFQLPEPTTGYRLPNGEFVATPEEYVARMTQAAAERMAKAYVFHNAEQFGRGQGTKAANNITAFLQWQAVETHKGTLNASLEAYDAAQVAQQAEPEAPAEA